MDSILSYKEKVNSLLESFFDEKIKSLNQSYHITKIIENLKEFTLRKSSRVRPLLLIASYNLFKDINHEIEKLSIGIELMQTSLLIQDDIMDNDDLRRGGPSFHKIYEKYNGNSDKNVGMSMAVLGGDIAMFLLYDMIEKSNIEDKTKLRLISEINWIFEREFYGQSLDILNSVDNADINSILETYNLKTSTYTTIGPLAIGAILASAKESEIEKLKEAGYSLGLAFQIIDDLDNLFSNQEETGKIPYADLKEGKKTFILAKTLEMVDDKEKKNILNTIGNKNLTSSDAEKIKSIMIKSNAVNETKEYVNKLVENFDKIINSMNLREKGIKYTREIENILKHNLSKV